MRIYQGYNSFHPAYTIKGNQIYQYRSIHPAYKIKEN